AGPHPHRRPAGHPPLHGPGALEGHADVRSDVYSLGLTLYEMLALRPAFEADGQGQLLHLIASAEPARLDELAPGSPRDLVTIVHKAMAREPADRYPTAGALADDLRRFLDDRSILARRVSLPEHAWRWCRRHPAVAGLAAALLALVLLVTGGWLVLEQQQAERRGGGGGGGGGGPGRAPPPWPPARPPGGGG